MAGRDKYLPHAHLPDRGLPENRRIPGRFTEPDRELIPAARGQFEAPAELAVFDPVASGHDGPIHRLPAQVRSCCRQLGLGHNLGELIGTVRRFFARLDHDGIAGDQRRGSLARDHEQGEVPRQDANNNAQRPAEQENIFTGSIAGDNFAFNATSPLRHVVQVLGRNGDFHLRQRQDLALLDRHDSRQVVNIFPDQRGHAVQKLAALVGWRRSPLILGCTGCSDSFIGQLCAAIGNGTEECFGCRIAYLD